MLGEKNSAFLDIQKYSNLKQIDPSIHFWVGNLLFCNGEYADAFKAYSNATGDCKNKEMLVMKYKCHIMFKELD